MMGGEELAAFITADPLARRIWMSGCEAGLRQGHDDERAGMENLADLVARRQLILQACEQHSRAELVAPASATTAGGPVTWEEEEEEEEEEDGGGDE